MHVTLVSPVCDPTLNVFKMGICRLSHGEFLTRYLQVSRALDYCIVALKRNVLHAKIAIEFIALALFLKSALRFLSRFLSPL